MAHKFVPSTVWEYCNRCGQHKTHYNHTVADPPKRVADYTKEVVDKAFDIKSDRIDRHEMFLEIAGILRKRSTCNRGKVGCVVVQDRRIVSTGYNGSPAGSPHCFELGCEVEDNIHVQGCMRTVHAEANCIAFAAKHGVALDGGTMYSTHSPCHNCAKLIVSAGIKTFYYRIEYRAARLDVLEASSVEIIHCD